MNRFLTRALAALLALLLLPAALSPPEAEAAIPVFDGANFSQNLLTAVRTAQAILQRIRMIENQIRQIEWMIENVRDLENPTVADLLPLLGVLQRLLGRYRQAAVVTLESLEGWVETVYPGTEEAAGGELGDEQMRRFGATLETAKAILMATREIARDLPGEQALLGGMEGDLLATDGLLAAAQAGGLLTAAAAEQLVLLNQQLALANNLEAVALAHELGDLTLEDEVEEPPLRKVQSVACFRRSSRSRPRWPTGKRVGRRGEPGFSVVVGRDAAPGPEGGGSGLGVGFRAGGGLPGVSACPPRHRVFLIEPLVRLGRGRARSPSLRTLSSGRRRQTWQAPGPRPPSLFPWLMKRPNAKETRR